MHEDPALRRAARADPRAGDAGVRGAGQAGGAGHRSLDPNPHDRHQETTMTLRRRTLLQAGAAAGTASLAGFAASAIAQAKAKLRVGYLHTPAVDGQIWLGQQSGTWSKHGLELELDPVHDRPRAVPGDDRRQPRRARDRRGDLQFSGARPGQGVPVNNVEFATAQLWVRDERASRPSPTSRASRSRPRPARPRTCSSTRRCARPTSTRPRTWRSSTSAWPRR